MLDKISKHLGKSEKFGHALDLLKNQPRTVIAGLKGAALAFFTDFLSRNGCLPLMVVSPDLASAEELLVDLSAIKDNKDLQFFPSKQEFKHGHHLQHEQIGLQLSTISQLLDSSPGLILTTVSALAERMPSPQFLARNRVVLEPGVEYEMAFLVEELVEFGYERSDMVGGAGEFAVRGGLIDVFPFERFHPVRIEFFGDIVETIRTFDISNQRSKSTLDRVSILPPSGHDDSSHAMSSASLIDYISPKTVLLLDEIEQYEGNLLKNHESDLYLDDEDREALNARKWQTLQDKLKQFTRIEHRHLGIQGKKYVNFDMKSSPDYRGDIRRLKKDLFGFASKNNGSKTPARFIVLEEQFEVERLQELFQDDDEKHVEIGKAVLYNGFSSRDDGIIVVSEKDLFGRIPKKRNWGKYRAGIPVSKLNVLKPSDFVVHVDHGIGRYLGLTKIKVAGSDRECLKVRYKNGDMLYVNIDQLWRISKYSGGEGTKPELNRLGGKDWERIKEKARKSIEKMATGLLELYAARKTQKGFAYSRDQLWQKELEASFIYDETPDQLKTIAEVKRDMQSDTPMDRLICGDVGFGKTEIALRAAFKSVLNNKQVAILVPTTVLAQQHFLTFRERLLNYAVNIGHLSRFLSKGEQRQVVNQVKSGEIDIIIGTHRLLSRDIQFRELGLLIIDEEHRFGVSQKEKIKSQHPLVDVLSLTATPIPRTLHFSMAGSRDMSVINSPPKERLPVISQVLPFDKGRMKQAILDEVYRGGQVFVVHNAVKSIHSMENLIHRLIPDLRTAIAHGQMSSHDLEKIMTDFVEGKYDCLICTMIIEAGLDMPNVNTLIVNRADKLGLAQLYQIKGRVGRSNRQAYAYFFVPPFKYLTQTATKRLQTIEEHLELGSGLQIALKDLEIRGAGNLLGSEQSGFIGAIGFDLYCKLLEETVVNMRDDQEADSTPKALTDVTIDVDFDAFIPDDYVAIDFERVHFYQRLISTQSQEELNDLSSEIRDRFGPQPEAVIRLFEIGALRICCAQQGIEKLKVRKDIVTAYYSDSYYEDNREELLQKTIRSIQRLSPAMLRFLHGEVFGFRFKLDDNERSLDHIISFFGKLAGYHEKKTSNQNIEEEGNLVPHDSDSSFSRM